MSEHTETPITQGAHHVGLTVSSLDDARKFFVDVLGYRQVGEVAEYPAVFLTDGSTMITLWQVHDPASAIPFDRKNVIGLHHLAIAVRGQETLDALATRLEAAPDVRLEFAPEPLLGGPARHLMCEIPGGVRLELIAA